MLQRTAPALKRLRSFSAERKSRFGGNSVVGLIKKTFSPKRENASEGKGAAGVGGREKDDGLIGFEEFKAMAMDGGWSWIFQPFA